MTVTISGNLKDGTGQPIAHAELTLLATHTTQEVLAHTHATVITSAQGAYSMVVLPGRYEITLSLENYPPQKVGTINVSADAKNGSLNDFLVMLKEEDLRPQVIRRFEEMVSQVSAQQRSILDQQRHTAQLHSQVVSNAERVEQQTQQVATLARAAQTSQQQAERAQGTATRGAQTAQRSQRGAVAAENAATHSAQSAERSQQEASAAKTAAEQLLQQTQRSAQDAKKSQRAAASSAEDARQSAQSAAQTAEQAATQAASQTVTQLTEAVRDEREQMIDLHRQVEEAAERGEQQAQQATEQANAAHASQQAANRAAEAAASQACEQVAAQLAQTTQSLVAKGLENVERIERELQLNKDKAPLESPAFTGHPTAPTPDESAAGQEIATAAFVLAQIAQLINASPTALDTLQELAEALGNDPNFSSTVMTMIGQKLDKEQNGADIPDKARFLENIGIDQATTTRKGIVQLSDSVNSFSSTQAATPWAVTRVYDEATRYASTSQAGRVRLSDSISSSSSTKAATPWAVTRVYSEATRSASTSQAGRVRLSDSTNSTSTTQAATANAVKRAYDEATRTASTFQAGQVQLNDDINGYRTDQAATSHAVGRVNERVTQLFIQAVGSPHAGVPIPWPAMIPPWGWLICAGQTFSRSTYPHLATAYPKGVLPDLRGEFIRGYDNGRGADQFRFVLTHQADALQNITGSVTGISETFSYSGSGSGAFQKTSSGPRADGTPGAVDSSNAGTLDFNAARVVRTAEETRPRNVAFLYIVRAA